MLREQGHLVFPALSIPVENKDVFECPPAHVERLKELLAGVDKVIILGWRATEAEFLRILREGINGRDLDLMIVSGDTEGAQQTALNFNKSVPLSKKSHVTQIDSGFTGLLLRELEKLNAFLHQPSP